MLQTRKLILVNGIITVVGVLLDIYGIFDLSLFPALLGLMFGIVDCVTFIWMREDIREVFRRLRARQVVFQNWFEDMKAGKPQVEATIIGRSVLNRALFVAQTLGYKPVDVSEIGGRLSMEFTETFSKEIDAARSE